MIRNLVSAVFMAIVLLATLGQFFFYSKARDHQISRITALQDSLKLAEYNLEQIKKDFEHRKELQQFSIRPYYTYEDNKPIFYMKFPNACFQDIADTVLIYIDMSEIMYKPDSSFSKEGN